VMDDRSRGLTLSMTAIGSDARHSLSCIVYAPPQAGLTLDGAVAHIRAAMGLGEPTDRHEAGPARSSGASWLVGPALDQQRIGVDIASADNDAASSIAVITPQHAQAQSPAALALKAAVTQLKLTLPRDLNDSVTATDVRAEDMTIVYVLDIKPGHEIPDMKIVQDAMSEKLCASAMRAMIVAGASVTYEYWSPGPTRKLRGKFNIQLAPRPAPNRRAAVFAGFLRKVTISRTDRSRCTAPHAVRLRCRKRPRMRRPSCRSVRPMLRRRPDRISGIL
jgi:hypothetical protein